MARSATIASRCSGAASPCSTPAAGRPARSIARRSRTPTRCAVREAGRRAVGAGWGMSPGRAILLILTIVAFLFLIIEFVALVMGLALARSITSSIHELFMGTERVRHGDFTHRINIMGNDQLGELAGSFNQMIGHRESAQTAADKKARRGTAHRPPDPDVAAAAGSLDVPGLAVSGLCVPAREVGGDYYDFFKLPGDLLGVLIADVSARARRPRSTWRSSRDWCCPSPDLPVATPAARGGEPDHFRQPRYPQLHHDDLRRHRSEGRQDDLRAGRPPADLRRAAAARPIRSRCWSRAAWWSACASRARTRSSWNCSRRSRRPDQRRRDRALHRRHQRSDERRLRPLRGLAPQPDRRGARAPGVERAAGGSPARSKRSSAQPIRRRMTMILMKSSSRSSPRSAARAFRRWPPASIRLPGPWLISSRCSARSRQSKRRW